MGKKLSAYTDGSYNSATGYYGCGAVLIDEEGKEIKRMHKTGKPDPGANGWNVNGEIEAAVMAIHTAIGLGCNELTIYHDYEGVGKWPDNVWQAKKSYTKAYADQIYEFRKEIQITFIHVKGHHGNKWNEIADQEAGIGANGGKPDVPECQNVNTATDASFHSWRNRYAENALDGIEGLNPSCRRCLETFMLKRTPVFRDFAALRTGGLDKFSRMSASDIEPKIGKEESNLIRNKVHEEQDYASALRWRMRGLTAEDAAHKVNVDREISDNARKISKY